ncbi:unnamed protein product, partial [Prorocentrum cordatum]
CSGPPRCWRSRRRCGVWLSGLGPRARVGLPVTLKTKQDYERRLARFDAFCMTHGLDVESDADLEKALVEYMDMLFAREEPSNSMAKLLAAIGHRDPRLHHAGRLLKLPRVARALQG